MILSNTKKVIVINAGHDDHDPGNVMGVNTESAETKKIRDELVDILKTMTTFEVHVVPDSLSLAKSIDWANKKVPSRTDGLLIDIHLNAAAMKTARGTEAFYAAGNIGDNDNEIAETIVNAVAEEMKLPNRGAKPDTDTFVGSLGWLRQTKGESTLIEVCFMTNPEDWAELQSEGGHRRAAMGIAKGIVALWGEELKAPEKPIDPEEPEKMGIFAFLQFLAFFLNLWSGRTAEEIEEVKAAYEDELLNKKNVMGVGIGQKNKDGEMSVIVMVEKKEDISSLSEEDVIPSEIDGVPTDVIEIGEVTPMMACTHCNLERPVYGGLSAIWDKGTACTLGAIVYKDGEPYALMNTHCANPHWKGAKIGDNVIQPSPNDGGKKTRDVIGTSTDYEELILDGVTNNYYDAAIVKLDVDAKPLFLEGFGDIYPEPADVFAGDAVWKSGRTTGVQTSKVIATNVTMYCNYGDSYGRGKFLNQVLVENNNKYFTDGGDSSSLVVNSDRRPVGIIFAGSTTSAFFCPIKPIMERFDFSFDPNEEVPAKEGYMALAAIGEELYMQPIPETIQPGMQVQTQYAMNFRSEAEIGNNKLRVLPQGTIVEVTEETTQKDGYVWAKVRVK